MASTYNADGSIPAATNPWIRKAISGSTFATPTVLTVVGHGFGNGDTISVEGHDTNTNANGVHQITVIDANTFALNGVAGNGVGGATGYCVDYSVNPLITLPGDGDLANASSVNPAFEGIFNAVPYLYRRAGKYALIDHYETQIVPSPFPDGQVIPSFIIPGGTNDAGSWHIVSGLTGLLSLSPVPAGLSGDYLDVTLDLGSIEVSVLAPDQTEMIRGWGIAYETNGGSYAAINASIFGYNFDSYSVTGGPNNTNQHHDSVRPVSLRTPIAINSGVDSFNFALAYWLNTGGGPTANDITVFITRKLALSVKHYRNNR